MARRSKKPAPRLRASVRSRPSAPPVWWRRRGPLSAFGAVLLVIFTLWISGWFGTTAARMENNFYGRMAKLGLAVDEVFISGRTQTETNDIMMALDIQRGTPILGIDLKEAHTRLLDIPWIESARIERHLPNIIYVTVRERRPYARWQYQQELMVIDHTGIVLTKNMDRYNDLPLVVGDGANEHAAEILEELHQTEPFGDDLEAAIRVSNRRWDVRLNNGMTLRLPELGTGAALIRLGDLWRTTDIGSRNIKTIDARLPDRIIVDDRRLETKDNIPSAANGAATGKTTNTQHAESPQ